MRVASFGLAVLPLTLLAAPAFAQDATAASSAAIANGSYAAAEKALLQELRIHPGRPELLINLAAVYAGTGRAGDARALYQQVLSQDDVLMDLSAEKTAGSHAIAQTGLRRLAVSQMSSR
jgi:Flp pilus assembly protein TadD